MSWQDRPYGGGSDYLDESPRRAGMRSWFGGMPSTGRAVKWLLIANIGMFVLCLVTGRSVSPVYRWLAMETSLVLKGQIWRLFTFTYLHDPSTLWHVLLNMLGLYFLGTPLERQWGARRFFLFYTLGGLVAVLLYLIVTVPGWLSPHGILVGASGGVLAVLGACAVLFPGFRIIMFIFPVPIRTAAALLVLLYAFNIGTRGDNAGGDACHLAGLGFGVLWAYRGRRWLAAWESWRGRAGRRRWATQQQEQQALQAEVDRILNKVHREGIASLSRSEKRTLETATSLKQQAERHDAWT